LVALFFVVVTGFERSADPDLHVRFGLYWTLASGMGLSYGGFVRFLHRRDG
jgi:hypothetical protein